MYRHRLSLSSEVDLKKLRFFSVADDGGSLWTSPVDKQLVEAQRKVGFWAVSNNSVSITLNKQMPKPWCVFVVIGVCR